MAKRTSNSTPEKEPTYLTKSKSQFKTELEDRIQIGEDILKKNIQNMQDYEELSDEYSSWHDYNLELLKQSFNDPYNEYRKHYSDVASFSTGMFLGGRTRADEVKDFVDKFNAKVDNLKKLLKKIDLLRSSEAEPSASDKQVNKFDQSQVFIVHGHDDLAKVETAMSASLFFGPLKSIIFSLSFEP